jgi:cytidylate kinase
VRYAMVALQRMLAAQEPTVMVGRDIGTVVLPDAQPKVFLDASAEERARRRYEELAAAGKSVTLEDVSNELALRDRIDSGRDVSPLKPAADAIIIHTDDLSLEQVVERVTELVECS